MMKAERNYINKDACMIYRGMVIEHTTLPYVKIQKMIDIKSNKTICVDTFTCNDEAIKVVYNNPEMVVVLKYDGKAFAGKSRCNPMDKFDTQKGYDLAKCRAQIKLNQYKIDKLSK